MFIVNRNGEEYLLKDLGDICQLWFNRKWPLPELVEILKKEHAEQEKDHSHWVPPPFYWPSKKGLVKVADMADQHIEAVLRSFENRPDSTELHYWIYIFNNEMRKRHGGR